MRSALMGLALIASPALADPGVQAPIRAMEAAFNAGDVAKAKATHVPAWKIASWAWTSPMAMPVR